MHVGAYDSWKKYGHDHWLLHWDGVDARRGKLWSEIDAMVAGELAVDRLKGGSGERAIPVLLALRDNANSYELALNIPNEGYIRNLPDGTIVEVPAYVSGSGVTGYAVGDLPAHIAAWCSNQAYVAELAVDSAVKGCRTTALQSLLADPVINDIDTAEKILDEYLNVHADWLPQFAS